MGGGREGEGGRGRGGSGDCDDGTMCVMTEKEGGRRRRGSGRRVRECLLRESSDA